MLEEIISYISKNYMEEGTAIDKDTKLISSGIVDSINTLKIVDFIEETYGIELEANEVSRDNLDTPGLIVKLIERKRTA